MGVVYGGGLRLTTVVVPLWRCAGRPGGESRTTSATSLTSIPSLGINAPRRSVTQTYSRWDQAPLCCSNHGGPDYAWKQGSKEDRTLSDRKARKVAEALTGVSIAEIWPQQQELTRLDERTRPPSYLVKIALEEYLGIRLPRPYEKSAWAIPLSYEGTEFEISDWKRSTWSIFGHKGASTAASELAKKLSAAAKIIDSHLRKVCRRLLDQGEFSLNNQFHRYRALFEMFRAEFQSRLQRPPLPPKPSEGAGLADLGKQIEHGFALLTDNSLRRQGNLLAATVFFFSLSEVIFDACFALGDRRGMNYREFRALDWSERFRLFLPLVAEEERKVYERLRLLRRAYRNTPVHASPIFAFNVRGVGLVPATFEELDDPNLKSLYFTEAEDAESILRSFSLALELFENHPATRFGFAYAESGLAIHIADELLKPFKARMSSLELFKEFLLESVEYADAVENMDV